MNAPAARDAGVRLFVYYRVPLVHLGAAVQAATRMQAELAARHPGLQCHLLRRPELTTDEATVMETYERADEENAGGVTPELADDIEASARVLAPFISGPRHIERFVACHA